MSELRNIASSTIFNDSPLAKLLMGFKNVFSFGCSSLFTGEIFFYCSRKSINLLTLSCKWTGTLLPRYFLKIASSFGGRYNGEFIFPTSSLDVA